MAGWNPWHGCRKISEGCLHCYVYRMDAAHGKDSSQIAKTQAYDLPVRKNRKGQYQIPSGETVYTCFTSDFLLEDADPWRMTAWDMIRGGQCPLPSREVAASMSTLSSRVKSIGASFICSAWG